MYIYVPAVPPVGKIEMIIVRSSVRLASASAVMHISVLASESPGLASCRFRVLVGLSMSVVSEREYQ